MDELTVFKAEPTQQQVAEAIPHLPLQARNDLARKIGRDPRWVEVRHQFGLTNAGHLNRKQIIEAARELGIDIPKDRMADVMTTKPKVDNRGKTPPGGKIFLNLKEQIAIADLFKQHLKPDGDGYWKYDGDWNDERIAKASDTRANEGHVAAVRKSLYGALRRNPSAASNLTGKRPHEKLVALTARVDELERLYLELSEKLGG